ncbi:S1 family peptidase [Streptomyces sp. AS02]|uniref:S1 family peptidase n=1 Tax=Streptomyces sp. AS02 TaxID=2938946 RepID=UPI002020D97C|nr:S1 family peptidase [Streptomyces sp. AS02]MCL8014957.1 hypothetical protein [Streptomyces sp. AS02]
MSTSHEHRDEDAPVAARTSRRRLAALTTAAVVAAAGLLTASLPAGGTPHRSETSQRYTAPDPASYTDQAAGLPAGLKKVIRRELDLTPAAYIAAADAARSASAVVASLGGTVDDAWLDKDMTLHVTVADADAAGTARAAGARPEIGDPLAEQAAAKNAARDGRTYWVDRAKGEVASYDSSSMDAMDMADGTLAGGYGWVFSVPGGKARCSLGFSGTGAFGQPVNFTAGHCVEQDIRASDIQLLDLDAPVSAGGTLKITNTFGTPGSGNIGLGDDGGILNIAGAYRTTPTVSTWGGGQGSQDDGDPVAVYDAAPVITGMPVCKSGATTGWTCGHVTVTETTETIGDGSGGIAGQVTGFLFDACILSGDSGGAILSGNYAVGVDSFGNMSTCADAGKEDKLSGGFAVVSGTHNAETMFGDHFNLDISVGAPEIVGVKTVTGHSRHGSRAELTGTVAAATGATVHVRVAHHRELTATVEEGGTWSAELPRDLRPGRHTVTVTASHRPEGSALTTTGKTTRATITVPRI